MSRREIRREATCTPTENNSWIAGAPWPFHAASQHRQEPGIDPLKNLPQDLSDWLQNQSVVISAAQSRCDAVAGDRYSEL
jgi:hypothetical protein